MRRNASQLMWPPKWKKQHENLHPLLPTDFLLFRQRPAQASPLRSEASRAIALQSKKIGTSLQMEIEAAQSSR